jgi:uncharacterized protein YbjT (DUF2867 family)
VARILIVGGGCRGRRLAVALVQQGHAVRITTRGEAGRAAIEAAGAECFLGTPDRLATLRAALDSVTILCWLLGSAQGSPEDLRALHTTRLEFFLTQAIDTTVRGIVYEGSGSGPSAALTAEGERRARVIVERNAIPAAFLTAGPGETALWLAEAQAAVALLLTVG